MTKPRKTGTTAATYSVGSNRTPRFEAHHRRVLAMVTLLCCGRVIRKGDIDHVISLLGKGEVVVLTEHRNTGESWYKKTNTKKEKL